MEDQRPHLDIDAHVVRQLGDELITDAEQALLELVKNAYDADSEWCNVIIDTNYCETVNRSAHPYDEDQSLTDEASASDPVTLLGKITIEDNGCGMNRDIIQRGWLTVSISIKREMKRKGEVTKRHNRTPLGDKGLGRLGTMRLGNRLRLITHHAPDQPGLHVTMYWNDCQTGKALSTVPVAIEEIPATGKTGTTVEICGLSELEYWRGEAQLERLEQKLSTLISPFNEFEQFTVALEADNHQINLVRFPARFFDTALASFDFVWDQGCLDVRGRLKLNLLIAKDREFFNNHILPDNGDAFFSYLQHSKNASRYSFRKPKSPKWYLELSESRGWTDIAMRVNRPLPAIDPGPFLGELHAFGFIDQVEDMQSIARSARDYSTSVRTLSGVYVYRDNFRIRLRDDWLRLGDAQTSGGSYYGLRPKNTIGFFAVSCRDNPDLIEKSDREGFVENQAHYGFVDIAESIKDFANKSLAVVRRCYVEFKKSKLIEDQDPALVVSAKEGARQIAKLMQVSAEVGSRIKQAEATRATALRSARTQLKYAMSSDALPDDLRKQFSTALEEIERVTQQAASESLEVQRVLADIADKHNHISIIEDRFEQLEGQISEVYETVGVGLAAQALAHEIHPAIDEISACVRGLKSRMSSTGVKDMKAVGELEYIRSHAVMIGKRLSFIDPMLRTFREQKHDIMLSEFLRDFFTLRKERFKKFFITPHINLQDGKDIQLRINKGRLSQVVDNLARNSEYWLRKTALLGSKGPFEIHADVCAPRLSFWDTGPGVRPAMEEVCFDLFVSDKPKGEGHGLGLFIASQLLDEEDCRIFLSDERNDRGRRFKFVVDFSGVLKGTD